MEQFIGESRRQAGPWELSCSRAFQGPPSDARAAIALMHRKQSPVWGEALLNLTEDGGATASFTDDSFGRRVSKSEVATLTARRIRPAESVIVPSLHHEVSQTSILPVIWFSA
jgi:hypothetical protein